MQGMHVVVWSETSTDGGVQTQAYQPSREL